MKESHIVALKDVEMIRDGESYSAYVIDQIGEEYLLILKVKLRNIFTEKWKLKSFYAPVLQKVNDGTTIEIEWNYCRNILCMPHNIESPTRLYWLSQMKKIAKNSGRVPIRMMISGPWKRLGQSK